MHSVLQLPPTFLLSSDSAPVTGLCLDPLVLEHPLKSRWRPPCLYSSVGDHPHGCSSYLQADVRSFCGGCFVVLLPLFQDPHCGFTSTAPLDIILSGTFCRGKLLPDLPGFPVKSWWKPLWPHSSCILHPCKTSSMWTTPRSAAHMSCTWVT